LPRATMAGWRWRCPAVALPRWRLRRRRAARSGTPCSRRAHEEYRE
jgi:hypothetical protein